MSNRSDTPIDTPPGECATTLVDTAAVQHVLSTCADAVLLGRTASLFGAMGDPTRLRLLEALAIEELCVCDLARVSGITQSGVSHQLRFLRELGLVAFRREGNRAVYRLADTHVSSLLAQGFEHAAEGRA